MRLELTQIIHVWVYHFNSFSRVKSTEDEKVRFIHGRIIKWTQHIAFLTLAGMVQVVEGNHGNDSKRR